MSDLSNQDFQMYTFNELENSGLLWLINRLVFHPRGYTFGLVPDEHGNIIGWTVLGDGKTCLRFMPDMDDLGFLAAETFLAKIKGWFI